MNKLPTQYLELIDTRIAYTESGSGPDLLLLHGNSESKHLFAAYQVQHFKDYHTYALDSRGHGESSKQDTPYSIEQYSRDVIAFCKAKDISRAFVIGYSDGGNIALFLAHKAPQLFPKIIAISPNYLASGTIAGWLQIFHAIAGVMKFLGKLGLDTRQECMRLDLMLTDIGITAEQLAGIKTAVRLLYAQTDMIKESHFIEIARLIPGCSLQKIPRCHHMTILNQPTAIQDMRTWLAG